MNRRQINLGCVVGALGLVLLCCLLPYLVSSVYSIVGAIVGVSTAPTWLWGEWVNQLAGQNDFLYMLFAEGPICGVGTIALLFVVLGLVLALGGGERRVEDEPEVTEEPLEPPYIS
jgi:hypothetical protein